MANPSKEKGTKAETKIVRYLNERDWDAHRQTLSGNKDQGDILATPLFDAQYMNYVIEVKCGKQCENPNRTQLVEWMRQAEIEAEHVYKDIDDHALFRWLLVIVRYRRDINDADVYRRNTNGNIEHCWLDQINQLVAMV